MGECCKDKNKRPCSKEDGGHRHHSEHNHEGGGEKGLRALLATGLLLFAAGLFLEHILKSRVAFWLYLMAYLSVGWNVARQVVEDVRGGQVFTENLLMSVASIGAFIIGEHAEGAAVMVFYTLGEVLQNLAVRRSRESIRASMDLRPDRARVVRSGKEVEISPEEVEPGETVVIRPGDKIPLDGIVIDGNSLIDMSKLTGEFVPKQVYPGSDVLAGTINGQGLMSVRVTKPYGMSTAARIMKSVEEAEDKKAIPERFIRRFARYYTPAVFAIAALIAIIPPTLGYGSFAHWTQRALVMLVMACPCALVISVPLAYFAGVGRISRNGVLVKGAAFVDVLSGLDTIVFDKTGTLTEGSFKVRQVISIGDVGSDDVVITAAAVEGSSAHPIASSIIEYAKGMGLDYADSRPTDYSEIPGSGVIASVNGRKVAVGNENLMGQVGASYNDPGCSDEVCTHTVAGVAIDGNMIGSLHLGDMPKEMASDTIAELKGLGIKRIVMLSGDNKEAAEAMAAVIGVEEVHSGLLPHEKLFELEKIISQGHKTAFVGDGVNDAPALARADLGIAMGVIGSDAAIETADMVVMDDNLRKLPKAIRSARYTRSIAMQNIIGALAVKIVFLALGGSGQAGMVEALFADVGVTLLTVLNSFRLFVGIGR